MNKVVETRASIEGTPKGTADPSHATKPENGGDRLSGANGSNGGNGSNGNGSNGIPKDEQLEELAERAHPFG